MKNVDLLNIIYKWRKTLAIVLAISVVLSALFSSSYFIKPKYKSWAVIYPSNLVPYSQETPTEQMLQLFQSDSVFNHVVQHFNLVRHYGLDSASPTFKYKLLRIYNENISIKKTEFEAVRIEVLDEDPKVACEMINEMIKAFNAYTLNLNHAKSKELIDVFRMRLKQKEQQIDSINIALKELAVKYGITDYYAQSRELSRAYYRAIASGNERKITELTNLLRNLEERGGKFSEIQGHLQRSIDEYNRILEQYNTVLNDSKKYVTYTNVVVKPFPADKKSYPVRWLIVTVSACAALFFTLIVIMIIEGRKKESVITPQNY
jgi:uncharacterized protein involved in exopolysaccharide biosynthesis